MVAAADTRAPAREQLAGPGALDLFRDPLRCFVLVALLVGGTLVFLVPPFGGTDEPAHFFRAYQVTTGRLVPAESPDPHSKFHGACIPDDLIRAVDADVAENLRNVGFPAALGSLRRLARCPGAAHEHFYTFSTFGSPVPYLPQAATIGVARIFDADARAMDRVGRITVLLVYVLLVAIAIRRTPRGKWAFLAVALLPVALFQAATVSHDGLTIAISLLVVSSALRIADPPEPLSTRSMVLEAAALSLLLALCKPTYVVLAFLYLLPLLGPRRRRELRPLGVVVGGAVAVSIAFNAAVENLWRTDADLLERLSGDRGIRIDPDAQKHALVHRPWEFLDKSLHSFVHYPGDWVRGWLNVGDRVVDIWPLLLLLLIGVGVVVIALQADDEPAPFHWTQRALIAVTFVLGVGLVLGANYVYYTGPHDEDIGGLAARYFVPLLVLVPLVIGVLPWAWARARRTLVPLALGYVPFYAVFLVAVADRMR